MRFFSIGQKKLFNFCLEKLKVQENLIQISSQSYGKKSGKTQRAKLPSEGKSSGQWSPRKLKQNIEYNTETVTTQHEIVDDVWLMNEHGSHALDIDEAINYHKELAQPCMFNNMNGFFHIRMILDMKSKKKGIYSSLESE